MHRLVVASILAIFVAGCGANLPVGGVVTLDDKPLAHAVVTFKPTGETPGLGGSGRTDAEGKFTIVPARDGPGLPAGPYKVMISRPLRKDGSPPDPNTPPIESDARETLPPRYTDLDATKLTAAVSGEKRSFTFSLTSR